MKRNQGFVPSVLDRLESRIVLSKTTQGLSVVVSGLSPHLKAINREQQAFSAEINQAFSSFQSDYDQARATYFASIQNQTSPTAATTNAFTLYTTQRVSLLSQQLINVLIQSPQGTAKAPGQPYALEVTHLEANYRAARASSKGLTCEVTTRNDSAARHLSTNLVALHAQPGQRYSDRAGCHLERLEHAQERSLWHSEG